MTKNNIPKKFIVALAIFCTALVVANIWISTSDYMAVENYVGFYAITGFTAFAFIIFATKIMKKILSRSQNYYGKNTVANEKKHPKHDTQE